MRSCTGIHTGRQSHTSVGILVHLCVYSSPAISITQETLLSIPLTFRLSSHSLNVDIRCGLIIGTAVWIHSFTHYPYTVKGTHLFSQEVQWQCHQMRQESHKNAQSCGNRACSLDTYKFGHNWISKSQTSSSVKLEYWMWRKFLLLVEVDLQLKNFGLSAVF